MRPNHGVFEVAMRPNRGDVLAETHRKSLVGVVEEVRLAFWMETNVDDSGVGKHQASRFVFEVAMRLNRVVFEAAMHLNHGDV